MNKLKWNNYGYKLKKTNGFYNFECQKTYGYF